MCLLSYGKNPILFRCKVVMAASFQVRYCSPSSTLSRYYPNLKIPQIRTPLHLPENAQKPVKTPHLKEICKQGNLKEAFLSFTSYFNGENPSQISPDEAYSSILELCAGKESLTHGQQIHACVITSGLTSDSLFLNTKLVFMYGKCGALSDAQKLFDIMPLKTIFTWNAMIGAYLSNGEPYRALELYSLMRVSGISVDAFTFPSILKACGLLKNLHCGTEIHGLVIKCGYISFLFVINALVAMYAKCDDVSQARQLFDRDVELRDAVSWNSIITAYSASGQSVEALKLFRRMQKAGVTLNSYTIVGVLQACEEPSFVKLGMEIHAALLKSRGHLNLYEANSLAVMYARCGRTHEAENIFLEMDVKDNVSWNSMLSGFVQNGLYNEALIVFREMQDSCLKPDQISVISIVSASGRLGNLLNGMEIHAWAIRHGLDSNLQVGNTLLDMYAKCSHINYMGRIFDRIPDKDLISWTTVIAGYAQNHCHFEALELFRRVEMEQTDVDVMIIGSILLACSGLRCGSYVKQIHNYILRWGLFDHLLQNTLVDVYGKCGNIEYASRIFEVIEHKDVVSWTSMISSYVHNGFANEALNLFYKMEEAGVEPDAVALVSILSAAASLSALRKGKEIHGFVIRKGFILDGSVISSLLDMYARCGSVDNSYKIFSSSEHKDLFMWTSMINASGMHGRGKEAMETFRRMKESDLIPDHVTFLALLYACSHSGLIEEGRRYFKMMRSEYQLEPWPEHYACVVDLLGRANHLDEAYKFVQNMQTEPTAAVWCALLGACRVHSNYELGEIAAEKLLELDPENAGNYVLVSNVFAARGRWKDVDEVRMRMKGKGLRKNPACSWIELGNKVHAFMVKEMSHPHTEKIYLKLTHITERLEKEGGYVADTKFVLHNVSEAEKVKMLYGHSERLAIAYGLIETPDGTPIRITKNLRVCGDCHVFAKLVSKFYERKIVVRDSNRFHHFVAGACSCGDFW